MDFYIGQICLFPWNWAPRFWLRCDGQELKIAEFTALYSLVGTTYGGDGRNTFALPKMPAIKPENGGDVGYFICLQGVYPPRH